MGSNDIKREVAFSGKRVRQKMGLALALSSLIPLLILSYVFYTYIMPLLDPAQHSQDLLAVSVMLIFMALLMAGGGFIIYDIASALSRAAQVVTGAKPGEPVVVERTDEIGTLVASFTKMMSTIEQQSQEINNFPRQLDQLTRQAFQDALTGLPNRALFMDRLAHALARTERRVQHVAVLFLDLDRFKVVNDSLGHGMGDRVLVESSARLLDCVRPEDTVARLGGDEFAILLEDLDSTEGATSVAQRVTESLEKPFLLEGREVFVTMSVGVALNIRRPVTPEELLRDADLAMYRAKGKGKNRFEVFDPATSAPAINRFELELDLRGALTRGEFVLHYQPVVHLGSGRMIEVEALVRWQHRERGLLQPEEFISLMEETGLIVPVGTWVLGEACRQLEEWTAQFPHQPPLTMSVNLSARQLQDPGLVRAVEHALAESHLDPACLKLEITETVVMQDAPSTLETLHALKALGVQLAIDDFGTGYSSLGYLKRFPVDTLKIDRSFVQGVDLNAQDTAIVRAVISVAKSLNLSVTAEGIETNAQLSQLQHLGCDRGQGYLFARPLAAEPLRAALSSLPVPALPKVAKFGPAPTAPAVKVAPARVEPPRSEPARVEPPRSVPPRSEPARVESPRSEPARVEPARSVPPRSEPAPAASMAAASAPVQPAPAAPAPSDKPAKSAAELLQERIAELLRNR
jgi:diguanylate cyclase (GGDEF)-like protein